MIKIDTKQFDMDVIQSIYDKLIEKIWRNYVLCDNQDVKQLFKKNFVGKSALVHGEEEKSFKENMKEYLLTDCVEIIKDMIEAFSYNNCKGQLLTNLKEDEFHKELRKVLSYDILSKDSRHKLVCAMKVSVCPYCNRQYITSFKEVGKGKVTPTGNGAKKEEEKATADLDHFYLKDEYPIAALCLFNLVPSCQICNSRFKHKKNFYVRDHVHPYLEEFDKHVYFEFKNGDEIKAFLDGSGKKPNEYEIELRIKDDEPEKDKYKNSIKDLKLNEVYNSHSKYIDSLFNKMKAYSHTQIREYLNNFPELFLSEEDFLEFLYGQAIYPEEHSDIPLGKLTYDILKQYGIIN